MQNKGTLVVGITDFEPMDIKAIRGGDLGITNTDTFTYIMKVILKENEIKHDYIRPFTPKHNGKVERSHRKDEERFYRNRIFYSLEDARKQIKRYELEYNKFPMCPLKWKSPQEFFQEYKAVNING